MESFTNQDGSRIVSDMIKVMQENWQYLSEVDGAIGDGDHGINMKKGFTMTAEELRKNPGNLTHSLRILSGILITNIGGALGPLYGMFFRSMAKKCEGKDTIDAYTFGEMMEAGEASIRKIGKVEVGDKTLLDTLAPAIKKFKNEVTNGNSFKKALDAMKEEAIKGRDSTKDIVAKVGRASRMGERSKGVLDPGATSMCLLLLSMADSISELLSQV